MYSGSGEMIMRLLIAVSCLLPLTFANALAQQTMPMDVHHDHHEHAAPTSPKTEAAFESKKPKTEKPAHVHGRTSDTTSKHKGHTHQEHQAHTAGGMHQGHEGMQGHEMKGFLGPYPMNREASGTSWQPDTTPHEGIHQNYSDWMLMEHALINGVYDHQGGPRGGDKAFVSGMVMGMAERTIGDGTLGFRAMLSPDPFMGPSGYPLLLATGETANGVTPLIDRQHPHDLFMEFAGSYSYKISATSSVFVYAGLPGEPALGPPAFMHRTSGMDIPEAPITHHWLDSTHITFGVVTAGLVLDNWKVEGSAFRGREPDQHRFDIEEPRLDSFSGRLTWNPMRELSLQVSAGHLHSPEQLSPEVNEDRITASATYTQPFGRNDLWSTTFAWGRKMIRPGNTLDGFLLESEVIFDQTYTLFMRAERVQEDELLENVIEAMPNAVTRMPVFTVNKLSIGGIYDVPLADHLKLGIGGLVSKYGLPSPLKPFYGSDPTSFMVFLRLKLS
jgi:hypothetical protein